MTSTRGKADGTAGQLSPRKFLTNLASTGYNLNLIRTSENAVRYGDPF